MRREILEVGITRDEMNILEAKYINESVLNDPLNINLDKGGRNNYSRWPEVNARIGKAMSKARKEHPENWLSRFGKANNKAAEWKLISPAGEVFVFYGGLAAFCASKGISVNTLIAAARQGWIPRRGACAGWQIFNLTTGKGTIRDTLNHGETHSGKNNPVNKHKYLEIGDMK